MPVLGAALTLSRLFTQGLGLSEDSVLYISRTRNLLQGADCASGDGAAYDNVAFAPGYAWGAGAGQLRTGDPLAVAGPLNAALHGAAGGAVSRWLQPRIASRVLVGRAGASSRVPRLHSPDSPHFSDTACARWTTLALIAFDRFLQAEAAWLPIAAPAELACLTRYVGLSRGRAHGMAALTSWRRAWLWLRSRPSMQGE